MDNKFKRYFKFMLIVLAAGSIYPMIYIRNGYQETILYVFGLDIQQLNNIYTALGFTFVVGYFPSGYLSDKFSAKWLLTVSLLATSLAGFWFAQIPPYGGVVAIFIIWGIFSVFTFWAAHMKLVKMLSTKEEEGRFFGILDGGRGLIEAILAAIALFIFTLIMGPEGNEVSNSREALKGVIYMYSGILLVVSILIGIFIKESDNVETVKREKINIKNTPEIFKNRLVYLMGSIIFMGYFVTWGQFFIGGHMEVNMGMSAVEVATLMAVFLWMRPIGRIMGGFLADKLGKNLVIGSSIFLGSLGLLLLAIVPSATSVPILWLITLTSGLAIFSIRGTFWSILGDVRVSDKFMGLAIGYISFWGYLPDVLAPQLSNAMFSNFGYQGGFNAYFIATAIIGFVGVFLCIIFRKLTRKEV